MNAANKRRCSAPAEVFAPEWRDVPQEHREILIAQDGLPCEGYAKPGWWCDFWEPCHYLQFPASETQEGTDGIANRR